MRGGIAGFQPMRTVVHRSPNKGSNSIFNVGKGERSFKDVARPSFLTVERVLTRVRIFKLLRSPGIDSKESVPASLCSLAGRYDSPIPTRFLDP